MAEFSSKQAFVQDMQAMFRTEGWRKYFAPELARLRAQKIDEMVYAAADPLGMVGLREAIKVLDELLNLEASVRVDAAAVRNDPEEAANVVHSTPDADADLFSAVQK
jgi:hypothetical protein